LESFGLPVVDASGTIARPEASGEAPLITNTCCMFAQLYSLHHMSNASTLRHSTQDEHATTPDWCTCRRPKHSERYGLRHIRTRIWLWL